MAETPRWKELSQRLEPILRDGKQDNSALGVALRHETPVDIALVINELQPEEIDRIFGALDENCKAEVLSKLDPDLTRQIIARLNLTQFEGLLKDLPAREAAEVIAQAPRKDAENAVAQPARSDVAAEAQPRLKYPEGSAGRLMTQKFVCLQAEMPAGEAMQVVHGADPESTIGNLFVVEPQAKEGGKCGRLLGIVSIRELVMADAKRPVGDLMVTDFVTVEGSGQEKDAANLLAAHRFSSLPVLDADGCLIGVIPSGDLMRGVIARLHKQYSQAVGADAVAMEKASPFQAAKMRVPWLLVTIILELMAGGVISHFNGILQQVILLASFMPVISAVSGNVGLQAAAITVRGLDTGQEGWGTISKALLKEIATALLMAVVCALVLGTIGVVWSRDLLFGVVIGGALGCSMLTAALMGTIIPMISKKLGFDPAATAGPFETSFQDIIGFGVFLGLATLLLHAMH